jgi:hypothetical protein
LVEGSSPPSPTTQSCSNKDFLVQRLTVSRGASRSLKFCEMQVNLIASA